MIFNKEDIKHISCRIRKEAPEITLCVTLPYTLSIKEQLELAQYLEFIGIDMLQTEGSINCKNEEFNKRLPLNKYNLTLMTTYSLSKVVTIPIIASSGLNLYNAYIAKSHGASCVGIKTAINNLNTLDEKIRMIKKIKTSLKNNIVSNICA